MKSKSINHTCHTISQKDLVDIWIETFHEHDTVVVIWDALKHFDLLTDVGFNLDRGRLFENKILTITVDSLDSALFILEILSNDDHPYVQIYSLGKYITDNIDK